jgi:hypothetical protein
LPSRTLTWWHQDLRRTIAWQPHGKGLTLPKSIERGNLSHNEASSG